MICQPCGASPDACDHSYLYRGRPCCPSCVHAKTKETAT